MKASLEPNVLNSLILREQGCRSPYRKNLKILKTLICKSNFSFKKVWEKLSKKNISCERSRIYFNNYRECYSRCGPSLEPHLDYVLDFPPRWKIEDALVCQLSAEFSAGVVKSAEQGPFRSSLFTVTNSNILVQFDLHLGTVLAKVYLSDVHVFRSLQWETEGHTIAVKSVKKEAASDVLCAVALFDVYPLQFIGMMEFRKSVFGHKLTGIGVSQGLVIAMHAASLVKIYSLHHILQTKKDMDYDNPDLPPPVNIQLLEAPPVLFEVRCAGHLLEIGGSPWHYLHSPPHQEGTFLLTNIATLLQAENGLLDFTSANIEPHRAVFHPDESGRIIHIGDSHLRVHKMVSGESDRTRVEEDFTIDVTKRKDRNQDDFPNVTKSGRIVRKRVAADFYDNCQCVTIEEVDYENELDLLCVTSAHHGNDLLGKQSAIYTGFYDNLTGKLLKEIALECSWESYYEHNVSVDLDTIVQTVKPKLGTFRCLVYRLVRQHSENG